MPRANDIKLFVCPGEVHPIPMSVHLARLAAYYPACADCPLRFEQGHLPVTHLAEQAVSVRRKRDSLMAADGLRGEYLNEIDRPTAARFAAAFAELLWTQSSIAITDSSWRLPFGTSSTSARSAWLATSEEQQPPVAARGRILSGQPKVDLPKHVSANHASQRGTAERNDLKTSEMDGVDARTGNDAEHRGQVLRPQRPLIVVGHDERISSPDIAKGVVASLRRMGCHVIDIGATIPPLFSFAVEHLAASGGVMVTGSGQEFSWTGLDFVGPDRIPWSREGWLDSIEQTAGRPSSRPTRNAGSFRSFAAQLPYEAGLRKHVHELRGLKVVCGAPGQIAPAILDRLFAELPVRHIPVPLPLRLRNLHRADDADVRRVSAAVVREHADLGIVVDDDIRRVGVLNEQGELIPPAAIFPRLVELERTERPEGRVVLERATEVAATLEGSILPKPGEWERQIGGQIEPAAPTLEAMSLMMTRRHALIGGGPSGRYWFAGSTPICDAVVTIARLLRLASRHDQPISEWTRR